MNSHLLHSHSPSPGLVAGGIRNPSAPACGQQEGCEQCQAEEEAHLPSGAAWATSSSLRNVRFVPITFGAWDNLLLHLPWGNCPSAGHDCHSNKLYRASLIFGSDIQIFLPLQVVLSLPVLPSLTQASVLELDPVTSALYQRKANSSPPVTGRVWMDRRGKRRKERKWQLKTPKCFGNSDHDAADHCQLLVGLCVKLPVPGSVLHSRSGHVSESGSPTCSGKLTPSYGHGDYSFRTQNTPQPFLSLSPQ